MVIMASSLACLTLAKLSPNFSTRLIMMNSVLLLRSFFYLLVSGGFNVVQRQVRKLIDFWHTLIILSPIVCLTTAIPATKDYSSSYNYCVKISYSRMVRLSSRKAHVFENIFLTVPSPKTWINGSAMVNLSLLIGSPFFASSSSNCSPGAYSDG